MADIPTAPDDYDRLLKLITNYGADRFIAGYRFRDSSVGFHRATAAGNVALDQIATLITQLQRKAGGGQ